MKLFFGFFLLLAFLSVGLLVAQGKDGRAYKVLTKLVRPIQMKSVPDVFLDADYSNSFDEVIKDRSWSWYQPGLLEWRLKGKALELTTNQESVWWNNSKGPMFYSSVKGDVEVSITVKARKETAPEHFPDKAFQFGGIMLRDPASDLFLSSENYVFCVVGNRGSNGIQIETKSTHNGWSSVQGTDWGTADVSLKIERLGPLFSLYAKSSDSGGWGLVQEYERHDLPEILQLGVIVYSYSNGKGVHDLQVSFSDMDIRFNQ